MKIIVFMMLFLFSVCSFSATLCITEDTVEYIDIGKVPEAKNGSDGNNAMMVKFHGEAQLISLPQSGNLDDTSGRGFYSLLLAALTAGNKITAWGNSSCSYLDRFRVHEN